MHILLVEDNPIDVRLVRRMLAQGQPRPYELVEATTIQEAIALLQRESVGVILLDLSLPDCRGLETFTRISEQAPDTPVIVWTGYPLGKSQKELESLNVASWIMKPPRRTELAGKIRQVLDKAVEENGG